MNDITANLTHVDANGAAQMVDITAKATTQRTAKAQGWILMAPSTLAAITQGETVKGNVLAVARVAGIQAAKKTADLIPMCHPLMLTSIKVDFDFFNAQEFTQLTAAPFMPAQERDETAAIRIIAQCKLADKTGVEMEALTAVSITALTIYDMCKALEKSMQITGISLLEKQGGKSGDWSRDEQ